MGLGLSMPWMLCWLAAVVLPFMLARLAVRRPRLVRWGPSDLLAAAARTSHLTRSGVPWLLVIVRGLILASAACAATRPWLSTTTAAWSDRTRAVGQRVAEADPGRIVVLSDSHSRPDAPAPIDAALGIRRAIESLAAADGTLGRPAAGAAAPVPPPTVVTATVHDLPPLAASTPTLFILADQPPPTAAAFRRLADAIEAGASLLICLGPRSLDDVDGGRRLSAWLDGLAGITVTGRLPLADSGIELLDGFPAAGGDRAAADDAHGFAVLPGPAVTTAAVLGGDPSVTILARSAPEGRPLLVEARRGTVCVSALPLSLPTTAADADAWSDLAAWPAFVPFVDRLVARLLAAAVAAPMGRPAGSPTSRPVTVPLAPVLIAAAIAWLLADWWLSRHGAGGGREGWRAMLPDIGRGAALGLLAMMAVAWAGPPPVDPRPDGRKRPVAVLIDVSPSMGGRGPNAASASTQSASRLEAVVQSLADPAGPGSPLDRIARERTVVVCTAAAELARLGEYPRELTASRLRSLITVAAGPRASRIGDAVVDLVSAGDLDAADDGMPAPAAIVIASDGAITAGRSWATAARAAAAGGVPLFAVAVGGDGTDSAADSLPPGFRITAITAPRLCHEAEPFEIEVSAEATAASGPLEIGCAADLSARPLCRAMLACSPAADGMTQRFTGTLTVPPRALGGSGSRLASPVISIGHPGAAGPQAVEAVATCPVALSDSPVRVLMIDAAPRFEYRFLERLLARDQAFEVERCLLESEMPGRAPTGSLPRSTAEWNRFDVVVLGDVAAGGNAADRAASWRSLREAAAAEGIGIAWIPGGRWWNDPDAGLDWLSAVPGGAAPPSEAYRLQTATGGRGGRWLPPIRMQPAGGTLGVEAFHPEVFAVLHPASLQPTARIIASAAPADGAALAPGSAAAAVIVDRMGAATILGHLCETWRWQRRDEQAYRSYWRRNLLALAEPHQLGRLFAATLDVRPPAPEEGDSVRIEIVPGRAGAGLAGLQLEISSQPFDQPEGATVDARRLDLPAPGLAGTVLVTLEGLAAGLHAVRLVPAADSPSPAASSPVALPACRFLVRGPVVETAGAAAATAALDAAARASGGAATTLDAIASLPEMIATAVARPTGTTGAPRGRLRTRGMAHLLMLALMIAGAAAWWQPRASLLAGEASR